MSGLCAQRAEHMCLLTYDKKTSKWEETVHLNKSPRASTVEEAILPRGGLSIGLAVLL